MVSLPDATQYGYFAACKQKGCFSLALIAHGVAVSSQSLVAACQQVADKLGYCSDSAKRDPSGTPRWLRWSGRGRVRHPGTCQARAPTAESPASGVRVPSICADDPSPSHLPP